MNQCRRELLEQYLIKVLQPQAAERERGRAELVQSALRYLNTADPEHRLSEPIVAIFSTNIIAKTSFDFAAARNVFSIMEKYVINLLDCPWKREFRKITMYSGFYKTRIEPSLKDAWKLLLMVGYDKVGMCLELKFLPDAGTLQDIAFEFFLASLECLIYKDIFQKVSSLGCTLRDIHKCRKSISGNSDALFKALSSTCTSERKPKGESREPKASSQVHDHLSKARKNQKSEKMSESEVEVGSGFQIGGVQYESSQGISKVVQLPASKKEGTDCEARTESIEAMLQEITPEMISDINIRRQVLTKLNARRQPAKSDGEKLHGSLPLHQLPHESVAASNIRPHTEPLLIPTQLKTATDMPPFTEPLLNLKQQQFQRRVVPNVQSHTVPLPVQKDNVAVNSDRQRWTEPLLIPKQEKVAYKMSSKSGVPTANQWQCGHCFYSNNAAMHAEKCGTCGMKRKEV